MSQRDQPGARHGDVIRVIDATTQNETYQLAPSFAAGRKIVVRRIDSGTSGHTVTVTLATGQSLDGVTNATASIVGNSEAWFTQAELGQWDSFGLASTGAAALATDPAFTGTFGPILNVQLLAWTVAGGFRIASATRDANAVITTASVVWPDGSTGTFTTDTNSVIANAGGAIDAYHVTYVNGATGTKTVTQTAVTRDASSGAVTAQPALTVT